MDDRSFRRGPFWKGRIDSASWLCGLWLLVLFALTFGLRTFFVFGSVWTEDGIVFQGVDSWYHVRLIENLVHHFPSWNTFDPYAVFPDGQVVPVGPFFDWMIGLAILIVGLGDPSSRTVELITAFSPAVVGAVVLVPVYFLGARLFDRTTGLFACALVAVLPGHFLTRSLLGYVDHHVAEVLFSTLVVLLIVAALRQTSDGDGDPIEGAQRRRSHAIGTVFQSAAAGFCLGLYLLTWIGGSLFVGILVGWLVLQFVLDHLHGRSAAHLGRIAVPLFVVALVMVLALGADMIGFRYHVAALVAGIVAALLLTILSRLVGAAAAPRVVYPVAVLLLLGAALGAFSWVAPSLFQSILAQFSRFVESTTGRTIGETTPLLSRPNGDWSLAPAWAQCTTSFYIGVGSLGVLGYRALRRGDGPTVLFCVWSAAMLAATLGQNRFGYYYAVNTALLTGFSVSVVLRWAFGKRRLVAKHASVSSEARLRSRRGEGVGKKRRKRGAAAESPDSEEARRVWAMAAGLAFLSLVFFPNFGPALKAARGTVAPSSDFRAAMNWLGQNTPEPFGDPNYYFGRYDAPKDGESYSYPESAYGVMAWWDYGYWITRMAHRIPNSNPGQRNASVAARFFIALSEETASSILDEMGTRYVVVDGSLPLTRKTGTGIVSGKFPSLAQWAGKRPETFFERCRWRNEQGEESWTLVYYPDYYRCLLIRLYVFRGRPFEPKEILVMTSRDVHDDEGRPFKEITSLRKFSSHAAAKAFRDGQSDPSARIVGTSPFHSCVPLEDTLQRFRLLYQSPTVQGRLAGETVSAVEIYEYSSRSGGRKAQ